MHIEGQVKKDLQQVAPVKTRTVVPPPPLPSPRKIVPATPQTRTESTSKKLLHSASAQLHANKKFSSPILSKGNRLRSSSNHSLAPTTLSRSRPYNDSKRSQSRNRSSHSNETTSKRTPIMTLERTPIQKNTAKTIKSQNRRTSASASNQERERRKGRETAILSTVYFLS